MGWHNGKLCFGIVGEIPHDADVGEYESEHGHIARVVYADNQYLFGYVFDPKRGMQEPRIWTKDGFIITYHSNEMRDQNLLRPAPANEEDPD